MWVMAQSINWGGGKYRVAARVAAGVPTCEMPRNKLKFWVLTPISPSRFQLLENLGAWRFSAQSPIKIGGGVAGTLKVLFLL